MRGLPEAETSRSTRTRRWDAVIVGSALPGLVAAARLGMRGARVLVLEEEAAAERFLALREPFWLGGAHKHSVLGACLRTLGVPLIDQRRIEPDPLAFQVVLPDVRLDVGEPHLTVDDWVAWGLSKPDEARVLLRAIADAAEAERDAMLDAPVVRAARRLTLTGRRAGPTALDASATPPARAARRVRGLPGEVAEAPPRLRRILDAQVRALCALGEATPSGNARARLLGAPLEGGASVRGSDPWLRTILRRRVESLYGEFRALDGRFRLVSVNGQPGVAPDEAGESSEVWVGRALVLNAPRAALAAGLAQDPLPEPLQGPPLTRLRHALHFRVPRELVPEGMGSRVILVRDPAEAAPPHDVLTIRHLPSPEDPSRSELIVATVIDAAETDVAAREVEMEAAVTRLMPFAEGRLVRMPTRPVVWDDDDALADPPAGAGWPGEAELRLGTRQPLYQLDRSSLGALGFEGELLLGWRGGDAIAAELA